MSRRQTNNNNGAKEKKANAHDEDNGSNSQRLCDFVVVLFVGSPTKVCGVNTYIRKISSLITKNQNTAPQPPSPPPLLLLLLPLWKRNG